MEVVRSKQSLSDPPLILVEKDKKKAGAAEKAKDGEDNAGNDGDMKKTYSDNHSMLKAQPCYSQPFVAPGRSVESSSKPKRFVLPGRRDFFSE